MEEQKQLCPNNNLIWAILCTVMCCVPLGVVAVVKATSVEKLWYQGQHEAAEKAAADAKKWAIIGMVSSAIFLVLYFFFVFFVTLLSEL